MQLIAHHLLCCAVLMLCMVLAACASTAQPHAVAQGSAVSTVEAPLLRLPPAALPTPMALQQRLTFSHGQRTQTVDALVESDASATRVVVHAQGQVALRLDWDGNELQQQRASWLPAALEGERVLNDLQLAYWPLAAIRSALPEGWSASEHEDQRSLDKDGVRIVSIRHVSPNQVELQQHSLGYSLRIESAEVQP